jgi:phosphate:Na+ symporter
VEIAITAAGGLALFLLAMLMMTDGLKTFAGANLRTMLAEWTSTPMRGVFAGVAVTSLVQSSSAVTIATIGFVNAGMLTLRQALGVIYGTNVGTTMTAWLVTLVGFGWKIDNLALPLLTVGVVLRIAEPLRRWRGLGDALAGFGLFFLALSLLQGAFAGLAEAQGPAIVGRGANVATAVAAGFVLTLLTQSSSAALAIILSAAASGLLALPAAAAAVIGANIGTTSTALLAVIKATPAAKRLALGHIAFNLITGAIALVMLPVALALVERLAAALELDGGAAPFLALFHTSFNVFGVLLMLPLAPALAGQLERLFHSEDENLARPQHLDRTLAATPALAVLALDAELRRVAVAVSRLGRLAARRATASAPAAAVESVAGRAEAVRELCAAVIRYASQVQTERMEPAVAEDLARAVRTARYFEEAARLLERLMTLRETVPEVADPQIRVVADRALSAAEGVLADLETLAAAPAGELAQPPRAEQFEEAYQGAKASLLRAMVQHRMSVEHADVVLDDLRATRRLVDQVVKAGRLLGRA